MVQIITTKQTNHGPNNTHKPNKSWSKSFGPLVLQISRLPEGSTGQIFATSSVIYQMKTWGLYFLKVVDDTSDSEY